MVLPVYSTYPVAIRTPFHPQTGMRLLGIPTGNWRIPVRQETTSLSIIDSKFADFSNWDAGTFDAPCFKQWGINEAWLGWWDASIATDQAQALAANTIALRMVYQWFAFDNGTGPQQACERAIQGALDNKVPFFCADVESDSATDVPKSPAQRITQLDAVLTMAEQAKLVPVIYTAPWFWTPSLANTAQFAGRARLILANYGRNDGTQTPIRAVNFGGWTECVIHQYWSLANFCGRQQRDLSYVWQDAFTLPNDPQPQNGGADVDYYKLAKLLARNTIDPQTGQPVDVNDNAALDRVINTLDMGGEGVAKALADVQVGLAVLNAAEMQREDLRNVASGDFHKMQDAHKAVFGD